MSAPRSSGWALVALAALALLVAMPAQAAINSEHRFVDDSPVVDTGAPRHLSLASGALDAVLPGMDGAFLVHDGAIDIAGLDQVCWQDGAGQDCTATSAGAFSVHLVPGGTGLVRFPEAVPARLQAPHAIAGFADVSDVQRDGERPFETALAAVAHQGRLDVGPVPPIAGAEFGFSSPSEVIASLGGLAPVGAGSAVEVRDGAVVLHRVQGDGGVAFSGGPEVAPVRAAMYVLPVVPGDTWHATPAQGDAAIDGVGIPNAIALLSGLEAVFTGQEPAEPPEDPLGGAGDALSEFLAGVYIDAPVVDGALDLESATIARYSSLDATLIDEANARYEGASALEVQDSQVVGAKSVVGPGWFKLPLWGWALWVVGIGLAIAVAVRKPAKEHERWDRLSWVGWVASPLALILVFWLWDLEMRAVWGTSMFTTAASGNGYWVLVGVQVLLLASVLGLLAVPLGMVLKHGLRLAGQGRFMGLSSPIATVLAFLLGAPLLLSYLELVLAGVLAG